MATEFRAPIDPPKYNPVTWQADEDQYLQQLVDMARKERPGNPLVGKTVRFPMADSHAHYLVWSTSPLQLVVIETGDAWRIPAAHMRGLRLADIKALVAQDEAMRALFASRTPKPVPA